MRIRIEGVNEVSIKLDRIKSLDWTERPLQQSARVLQAEMMKYPGSIASSRYIRTGTLGRTWTVGQIERDTNARRIRVGNKTGYAPWVQSHQFQARIHRGRWMTDRLALQRNERRIHGFFTVAFRRSMGQSI